VDKTVNNLSTELLTKNWIRPLFFLLVVILGLAYFFLFTAAGGSFLVKKAISHFAKGEKIEFQKARGSIIGKMVLEDIRVEGLRSLPPGSTLTIRSADVRLRKVTNVFISGEDIDIGVGAIADSRIQIQKADVEFNARSLGSMRIKVSNGRLLLPNSSLVLFYGDYANGLFKFNIYSKTAGIDSLITLLAPKDSPRIPVKGSLADLDLYLTGSVQKPVVKGTVLVTRLEHKDFSLNSANCAYDVTFRNETKGILMDGSIVVKNGAVSGPGTATVELAESKLLFAGPPQKPSFDINGDAVVDKIRIRIFLRGTIDKPELRLSSDSPLSQNQLLMMVATGRRWGSASSASNSDAVPADMAIDFIDYFALGGSGKKLADALGISGFSFTVNETKQAVKVDKSVTEKVEVGFGASRETGKDNSQQISQTVNADYKVTNAVSVSAEQETKQTNNNGVSSKGQQTDEKLLIKYKKSF
jgi:autotransporter translocation and assembly factor TamB